MAKEGAGSNLYDLKPQGPPPPLPLKFAKLQGGGQTGIRRDCKMDPGANENCIKPGIPSLWGMRKERAEEGLFLNFQYLWHSNRF